MKHLRRLVFAVCLGISSGLLINRSSQAESVSVAKASGFLGCAPRPRTAEISVQGVIEALIAFFTN